MATGFNWDADHLRDDVDYAVSHRAPPPIPSVAYSSTAARTAPTLTDQPGRPAQHPHQTHLPHHQQQQYQQYQQQQQAAQQPVLHRVPTEGATEEKRPSSSRRRGSLGGFLRGNSDNDPQSQQGAAQPTPPLPLTRIAQAQQEAAARARASSFGNSSVKTAGSNHARKTSGDNKKGNMLRKSSKIKQQQAAQAEQERLAREAAARRQPPHLPSLNPLPGIATFGGEEARTDYSGQYSTGAPVTSPRPTANFSRPGAAMAPPSAAANNSSSPAYAVRSGNAVPSSSPPDYRGSAGTTGNGEYAADQYSDRVPESMAHRGRYSYASSTAQANSVNSPRRVRRRKDPTPFNVLVIGAKNSGKTSFISFLRHSLLLKQQSSEPPAESDTNASKSSFTSTFLETEIDGERVGVTLWDSAGLERNIVDLQLREMAAFVEAKFEDTFVEEQKVMRTPGVKDTHIHCVFLLLDPVRVDSGMAASGSLQKKSSSPMDDDLDLQAMRSLWGKTTVIPVISKADTLTTGHMTFLKRAVWDTIKNAKLDPLEALELEDDLDEEDEDEDSDGAISSGNDDEFDPSAPKSKKSGHARPSSLTGGTNGTSSAEDDAPYIPMSILSPDPYDIQPLAPARSKLQPNAKKVGRRFPWGFADPYDPEHCDFGRLRDSIFSEWRSDLRELSRAKWYENWRTSRLKNLPGSKQRVKGGVTPMSLVPKTGRQFSPPMAQQQQQQQQQQVPRSVSSNLPGAQRTANAGAPAPSVGQTARRLVSGEEEPPARKMHVPGAFGADS